MSMPKLAALFAATASLTLTGSLAAHRRSAPQAEGAVLWNNLRLGMTAREVKSARAPRRVTLSESCVGKVEIGYERGRLAKVLVSSVSADRRADQCGTVVEQSLLAKYGPTMADGVRLLYGGSDESPDLAPLRSLVTDGDLDRSLVASWSCADRLILFKGRRNGGAWTVTYLARPSGSAKAAGVL